jgi:hypothetical protein
MTWVAFIFGILVGVAAAFIAIVVTLWRVERGWRP